MTKSKDYLIEQTSDEIATLASRVLRDPNATEHEKSLAGSAMSQADPDKETSKYMGSLASKILRNPDSSEIGKTLAGSVLTQMRNRKD